MLSRAFFKYGLLNQRAATQSLLVRPYPCAFFSQKATEVEEVQEATIVTEEAEAQDKNFLEWVNQDIDFSAASSNKVQYKYRKRETFEKFGFNPHHIPHQGKYPKIRKQRLAQWDDPNTSWPPKLTRPTMHKNKTLLAHIESDYRKQIEDSREFRMPDYRSGDVAEVTMFQSMSEGKFTTIKGLIYDNKKRNNLNHSFKVLSVIDDVQTGVMVKANSPLLAKMDVVSYGSNQLRKKLNYLQALGLSKNRMHDPVIKGRDYKDRSDTVKRQTQKKQESDEFKTKGQAKRKSVQLAKEYEL